MDDNENWDNGTYKGDKKKAKRKALNRLKKLTKKEARKISKY